MREFEIHISEAHAADVLENDSYLIVTQKSL